MTCTQQYIQPQSVVVRHSVSWDVPRCRCPLQWMLVSAPSQLSRPQTITYRTESVQPDLTSDVCHGDVKAQWDVAMAVIERSAPLMASLARGPVARVLP